MHRDLKPENMILGLGKEIHKLYLIDFGISKIYRDSNNRHMYYRLNILDPSKIKNHFSELLVMLPLLLIRDMS